MGLDAESWGGRGVGARRRRAAAVSAFSARADEASEVSFSKAQANYVQSLEREIARASPISSE